MTNKEHIDVTIEWPELVVTLEVYGGMEMTLSYDLDDIIQIEGEGAELVEVCDSGIVVEDAEGETHHIDLRDVAPESREMENE